MEVQLECHAKWEDPNVIRFHHVVVGGSETKNLLEHLLDGRRPLGSFSSETTADVFSATSTRLVNLCYGCHVAHWANKRCHGEVGIREMVRG